jgi:hypothetical protein
MKTNTLILVPLGEIYVNPEEIAHIRPHETGCYIAFKSNVAALHIPLPVADVLQRLANHLDSGVVRLAEAAEYLASAVAAVTDTKSDTPTARHWKRATDDVNEACKALGLFTP